MPISFLKYSIYCALCLTIITVSCEREFESVDRNYQGGLVFERDTISFDTLFTSVNSITKRFKVYNPHTGALNIDEISLTGADSPYILTINGERRKQFNNQLLFAKDSLLVLVEAEIDPLNENLPFLIRDSISFQTNGVVQFVQLEAWGQDAHFIGDSILSCDQTWINDKPYVIYNDILIDSLCRLTIEAGTRIFCAFQTEIFVQGSLHTNGTAEQNIMFTNERQDGLYADAAGQWGGIYFLEGSKDNELLHTTVRNARLGLRIGTPDEDTIPDVSIRNSIIENMSEIAVASFTSDVYIENSVIANGRDAGLAVLAGGNLTAYHVTIAGYSVNFFRQGPGLVLSDFIELDDGNVLIEPIITNIQNCIVFGDRDEEVIINLSGETQSEVTIKNNLLKTQGSDFAEHNIINEDPLFISPIEADYHLDTLSIAQDAGVNLGIPFDLEGNMRDTLPDLGAYERLY